MTKKFPTPTRYTPKKVYMISCNECGAQCKNFVSLAQHVTKVHKVDTESYFLK